MLSTGAIPEPDVSTIVEVLRRWGARFAFLHGSRARGAHRPDSDIDIAAWFGVSDPPAPWDMAADLPARVDLLVLDRAPLTLAGKVALHGVLLFDDDPPARVSWQADTRLMYLDEEPLQREMRRVFMEARIGGR